ncbi:MAG TPA: vitamin K epoxide reductase family protein [Polyangiaceae bacterium]
MKRTPFLVLAALGLALSVALAVLHARAYLEPSAETFCAVGGALDCTSVALSRYSVLLGVPVPLWGALGFLAILVAAIRRSRWLLPLSAIAAIASVALLVVELVAIGALCLLCEGVHLVSFALVALAWRERARFTSSFANRDDLALVFAPPAGLAVALFLFVPRYWVVFGWKGDVPFAQGKTAEGYPWLGAEHPKVTVEEFTDYQCPHCRVASARSLKRLAENPSLRLVRRQFPRVRCRAGRDNLCQSVRIAYCAGEQGRFWHADRWLFEHAPVTARLDLARAAGDIGLDLDKLRACVTRSDIYERAVAESELAKKKRFPGTPYYVVGDKRTAEEGLSKLLDALP